MSIAPARSRPTRSPSACTSWDSICAPARPPANYTHTQSPCRRIVAVALTVVCGDVACRKPREITQLFDAIDVDHTGEVSIASFMLLVQRGTGVDAAPAPGAEDEADAAAMPETAFVAEPQMLPAEIFKTQIAEASPAHVAVGKIISTLDDRKIKLRAAFKKLDADNDGSISAEDLPKGLASIGIYISPARASKMVAAFDRTGNGRLAYHEFVRLLSATRAEEHEEKAAAAAATPVATEAEAAAPAPTPAAPAASEPEPEVEVELVAAGTEEGGLAEPDDVESESLSDVLAAISYSVYSSYRGARKAFGAFETTGAHHINMHVFFRAQCRSKAGAFRCRNAPAPD
jgi:Ca2+-binding EF-hand superfamily protein